MTYYNPFSGGLFGLGVAAGKGLLASSLEERKRAAWEKAFPVPGYDPNQTRKDACGWWISWVDYGDRNSPFGWEVDHGVPTALGGSHGLSNLRALHWYNNARLGGLLSSALR